MEVEDHATVKLEDVALSPVKQLLELSNIDGDIMFASFEIYDNSHPVGANIMKDSGVADFTPDLLPISQILSQLKIHLFHTQKLPISHYFSHFLPKISPRFACES